MKRIILLFFAVTLCGLLAPTLHADCCPKRCKPCPPPPPPQPFPLPASIVGTWVTTEQAGNSQAGIEPITSFATMTINNDETMVLHRSLSIQQPVISSFQSGNYSTIDTGVWRASIVNPDRYLIKSTAVVNVVTTGIPDTIALPFVRALTMLDVTIDPTLNTITYTGSITLYPPDDLLFVDPLIDPTTQLPYVTNLEGSGFRFDFLPLEVGP